ncbi:MAG: hypothetical protein NTV80_11000 [Verrucomicrobia bacterium]|nr:hypothetical protein [Verrucomicrobiota bacterium]
MKPDPRSAEFITLIDRWLDQTATAEEAARLWQAVAECPQCAAALAAASRFESLLETTVQERASERKMMAPAALPFTPRETQQKQRPLQQGTAWAVTWNTNTRHKIAAAAAVIVVGFVSVYFWNEAGFERPPVIVHELVGPIQQPPLKLPKASNKTLGSEAPKIAESTAQEPKELLTEHLDRFFLTGVSLDNIPLSRAIGILQGQLNEVNRDAALALDELRVLVPTGAAQRKITFHSGPIPFLKAVRAVAALAGCEVEVSEPQITITIQQSIYPELVKKRVLSDMLAGRLNATGTPSITDPERLAALREDAESLGVKPAADGSVAITRGQWEALKMLTETRDLLGRLPMPSYAIYALPKTDQQADTTRVLTPEEVQEKRKKIAESKAVPLIIFTPQVASPTNRSPIQFQPYGDSVSLTLHPAYDPEAERRSNMGPNVGPDPVVVSTLSVVNENQTLTLGGGLPTGRGAEWVPNADSIMKSGVGTLTGAGTSTYNVAGVTQAGDLQLMGNGASNTTNPTRITVASNVSAEMMATAVAQASASGSTLVILPNSTTTTTTTSPPPPA